jgi:SpoVK/Ycf46/Vps4 family AAA+-type ATPase
MSEPRFPGWADELRRRYLRGEASVFVLYGNVHDLVLHGGQMASVSDFLATTVLQKKDTIIRYNVSTGCRFLRQDAKVDGLEELLVRRSPEAVLPILEKVLFAGRNVGLVIDYAEMVAPTGDAAFSSDADRLAVVTLQRWSLAPQLQASDSVVCLLTEAPNELHAKIMGNPRVAAVEVPMPSADERRTVIRHVNPALDEDWLAKLTDVTAGLKAVQIDSILQPPADDKDDAAGRRQFIESLVGKGPRADKLVQITQGMSRDEIAEVAGVEASAAHKRQADRSAFAEALALIGRRKREIIERECFGLIEFVDPGHDFSVVGGVEGIKSELSRIARNIREGNRSRVPMGLLFVGPMGTGKTFVAEAFVKESSLTGIKLKSFRSKWLGATESNLERILGVVKAIGNVIVIIDEGDRSFGSGGDGGDTDGGTSSRVVARLKEFMSDTSNRGRVLFIMMTNRPDKLDIDIKRAGRLDRKIPFLYAQTPEEIEGVLMAQIRKHKLATTVEFPRDRAAVSQPLLGYSNADLEALALLAYNYATADAEDGAIGPTHFAQAVVDYLPSRDVEMLEYMELLAVFEASNRRMLPDKYAAMSIDDLQDRLGELRLRCAGRR